MKTTPFIILLKITIIITLSSCNNQSHYPKIPTSVNAKTDCTRNELITYYKEHPDQYKEKAAMFLLENGKYHYHFEGAKIKVYTNTLNEIKQHSGEQHDHLSNLEKQIITPDSLVYDIMQLPAEDIINHVDKLVDFYKSTSWSGKVTWKIFCEYLLPYNIGLESFSQWTDYYREKYFAENDSTYMSCSFKDAVTTIHQWDFQQTLGYRLEWVGPKALTLPEISAITLGKLKVGSCQQLTKRSCAILRSLGIPATIDYVPSYLNMDSGHYWAVAILNDTVSIPLDATTKEAGIFRQNSYLLSKVYRTTFSIQENSHAIQRGHCDYLPSFLNDPYILDVTSSYTNTSELEIPIERILKGRPSFVYLSLFTARNGWQPIAWGHKKNKVASFKNVGKGGVYLPVSINKNTTELLNSPFILTDSGDVKYLIADTVNRQRMKLIRKFPMNERKKMFLQRMVGGVFQGANTADFSDAVTLAEIKTNPGEHMNTIVFENRKGFRYVRYFAPRNSNCNVAEVEFYSADNKGVVLRGEVLGTDGSWENNPLTTKNAVFDANPLTFFDSSQSDNAWVGLDLGRMEVINKIRFLARNDMNAAQTGDEYELFYWNDKWVSLGRKVATAIEIVYEDVPSHALYWLKNHTGGKEERIFTYEDDTQIWW